VQHSQMMRSEVLMVVAMWLSMVEEMFNADSPRDTSDSANSRFSQTVGRQRLRKAYINGGRSALKSLMCKCAVSIEAERHTDTPLLPPHQLQILTLPPTVKFHTFSSLLPVLSTWKLVLQCR
jgi:hypothetical protein